MEYDDFSLPKNYEKMASAYCKALEKKGFIFMRLTDETKKIHDLAENLANDLLTLSTTLSNLKKFPNKKIFSLKTMSEFQANDLIKLYNLSLDKTNNYLFPSFDNILSLEAKIIKSFFELLELEDDQEKNLTIKNMLTSRLDLLSN